MAGPDARASFSFDGPLDLFTTVRRHAHGPQDPTMTRTEGALWRATSTPEGPATVRMVLREGRLEAHGWGPGAAWAVEGAGAMAGLDDLPERFDPAPGLVRELHRRYLGVRIGRSARVVDSLVATILGQRVTSREAHRSYRSLLRRYGAAAPGPVELLVPPPPGLLAGLPTYEFHALGLERRRAETIKRVAARSRRMEEAASMPPPEASRRIQAVPGVGPWTAALVQASALGDPDAVPVGDYHIPDVVAWNLAGEPRGDDRRMLQLLEPFRGQRGRVVWLLEVGGRRPPAYGPRTAIRDIRSM